MKQLQGVYGVKKQKKILEICQIYDSSFVNFWTRLFFLFAKLLSFFKVLKTLQNLINHQKWQNLAKIEEISCPVINGRVF